MKLSSMRRRRRCAGVFFFIQSAAESNRSVLLESTCCFSRRLREFVSIEFSFVLITLITVVYHYFSFVNFCYCKKMSSLHSKQILVILEQWQFDDEKFAISKAIGRLSQVRFVAFFNRTMK